MKTSRSDRRARRGGIVRIAGWLSAGAMIATAAFAPASVAAANPTSMDVACNNIVHGARSPEYVWTTVDAAGVTANWAIDADHLDAANQPTVNVRVCVSDAGGADQGGIDQNTENDGVQLFPWSVFGYAADPCPNGSLTFGSSVDSAAIQTKKSNLIECPAADEPTNDAGDQPTDDAGDQPTDNAGDPTDGAGDPTDNGAGDPTDNAGDPTDGAGDPTDNGAGDPTDNGAGDPTDNAGDPSDDGAGDPTDNGAGDPTDNGAGDPTDNAGDPSDNNGDTPTDSVDEPTGAVLGIVGTPRLTPPPTDTQLSALPTGGNDGWRMVLVLMAAVLIGSLAVSQPRRARRRS